MSLIADVSTRIRYSVIGFTGDELLMSAAVSAAALVITADGEIAQEEVQTALADLIIEPTLRTGYLPPALAIELRSAIERACTPAGRSDNLSMVSAINGRSVEQRSNILLIAIDIAMVHRGISDMEENVIKDLAERLNLDNEVFTEAVSAQRLITGTGVDLSYPKTN